jgi:hypothetical protein
MPQLFTRQANTHARVLLIGAVLMICGAGWVTSEVFWSPYTTYVDVAFDQPVPFSHKHHVGDDGIDCRFCHNAVEKSAFAGMPSSQTCMSCHSQFFSEAPILVPFAKVSLATRRCNGTASMICRITFISTTVFTWQKELVVRPVTAAPTAAKVKLVTGDTKVVDRGKADKIFINTSGIGIVPNEVEMDPARARVGARESVYSD